MHHITEERLLAAFRSLKKNAASGADRVTWQDHEERVQDNIRDLHARLHRGAYRAKPTRRTYIGKADGRQRPLGITALEDKIVQRATSEVLNAIYEMDFLGFSYGCRPGRHAHQALDALAVSLTMKKVSWVLDADIRGFFDSIDHAWLVKFLEHRIADKRMLRLIQKWLNAGVMENGQVEVAVQGTPQGSVISPLLANVYMHYAFDLWVQQWRTRHSRGEVYVVRYVDDFVVGFQYERDARRFMGWGIEWRSSAWLYTLPRRVLAAIYPPPIQAMPLATSPKRVDPVAADSSSEGLSADPLSDTTYQWPVSAILGRINASSPPPKAGAQCVSSARWDLCGGSSCIRETLILELFLPRPF